MEKPANILKKGKLVKLLS